MQIGDKYLAEWWFGYDMVDCIKGEIEIINIWKGHNNDNFSFNHVDKWGTRQFSSPQCRNIELIKKIEN